MQSENEQIPIQIIPVATHSYPNPVQMHCPQMTSHVDGSYPEASYQRHIQLVGLLPVFPQYPSHHFDAQHVNEQNVESEMHRHWNQRQSTQPDDRYQNVSRNVTRFQTNRNHHYCRHSPPPSPPSPPQTDDTDIDFIDEYIDKMENNQNVQNQETSVVRRDHNFHFTEHHSSEYHHTQHSPRWSFEDAVDDGTDLDLGHFRSEMEIDHIERDIDDIERVTAPKDWYFCGSAPCTPSRSVADSENREIMDFVYDLDRNSDTTNTMNTMSIGTVALSTAMAESNGSFGNESSSEREQWRKWRDKINGEESDDDSKCFDAEYNEQTGGTFFERECGAKQRAMEHNVARHEMDSWLKHIGGSSSGFSLFLLSEPAIYEELFSYLDGRSLLSGLMATCKKLHYLRFMGPESLNEIWNGLVHRDFPRLFRRSAALHIPYLNRHRPGQLEDTVLSKRVERGIYFSKISHDPFWRTVFNLKNVLQRRDEMRDMEMERILSSITWKDVLFGKEEDGGFAAYKRMVALRHHPYIRAFAQNQVRLPRDERRRGNDYGMGVIDRFCIALTRHIRSGWTVLYFDPWITSQRRVPWKYSDPPRPWMTEYGSCFYAEDGHGSGAVDDGHSIPEIVRLIGRVYVNATKASAPMSREWVPFLQTFDPSICDYMAAEPKYGWFYRQFMCNEMEDRLRNLRTLIAIVR